MSDFFRDRLSRPRFRMSSSACIPGPLELDAQVCGMLIEDLPEFADDSFEFFARYCHG